MRYSVDRGDLRLGRRTDESEETKALCKINQMLSALSTEEHNPLQRKGQIQ